MSKNDEIGGGRAAPDRQFIFVNSRPVDAPFLTKILNSEWRKISSKKYPVIVLNINVDQSAVDVNLAPDKRTVLLQNQKHCQFRVIIVIIKVILLFRHVLFKKKIEKKTNILKKLISWKFRVNKKI